MLRHRTSLSHLLLMIFLPLASCDLYFAPGEEHGAASGGDSTTEDPQPTNGFCYSDENCFEGYVCDAQDACIEPPGGVCPNGVCPEVPPPCYGRCEPVCDSLVSCDDPPPKCKPNHVPRTANGCWTGDCVWHSACRPVYCEEIINEAQCIGLQKQDCRPIYKEGPPACDLMDSTCDHGTFVGCHRIYP